MTGATALRRQYHFRPSPGGGFFAWDIGRLIDLAAGLPVLDVPLSRIAELNENWWFQTEEAVPSPAAMIEHFRLMRDADLSYPIILCAEGRLMDGMHRAMKAMFEGHQSIRAYRFDETPPPDHANIMPSEIDYT